MYSVNDRVTEIVLSWNAINPLQGIDENVDSKTIKPSDQNWNIIGMIVDLTILTWYVVKTHNCAIQLPTLDIRFLDSKQNYISFLGMRFTNYQWKNNIRGHSGGNLVLGFHKIFRDKIRKEEVPSELIVMHDEVMSRIWEEDDGVYQMLNDIASNQHKIDVANWFKKTVVLNKGTAKILHLPDDVLLEIMAKIIAII